MSRPLVLVSDATMTQAVAQAAAEAGRGKHIQLVEAHRGEAFADSALAARKFGMKHAYFVRVFDTVLADFPDLRVMPNHPKPGQIERYYTEQRVYIGTPYKLIFRRVSSDLVAFCEPLVKLRQARLSLTSQPALLGGCHA